MSVGVPGLCNFFEKNLSRCTFLGKSLYVPLQVTGEESGGVMKMTDTGGRGGESGKGKKGYDILRGIWHFGDLGTDLDLDK